MTTDRTVSTASSPMYYIAMVTGLFESIAVIVDQHQPIVDKYYGQGKMLRVAERLMGECDRVVKGLVEGWEEERGVKRKASKPSSNTALSSYLLSVTL